MVTSNSRYDALLGSRALSSTVDAAGLVFASSVSKAASTITIALVMVPSCRKLTCC